MSNSNSSTAGDGTYKKVICTAASTGDWAKASSYNKTHPNWISTPLTMDRDTALHIAVRMQQINFVTKLIEQMTKKDMEIHNADGNTAFCLAAISGNVKIAKVLFEKNQKLMWIKGHKQMLPIQLASSAGQICMVEFLFKKIQDEDMHINLSFQDITKLFFLTLNNNIYSAASSLLEKYPELAHMENENGLRALQVLAQSPFEENAPHYKDLVSLLFKELEEEDEFLQHRKTSKAMFDAAVLGNIVILESIFNYNLNMFLEVNSEGHSLLHVAILHRQKNVYNLILSKGSYKNVLVQLVDHNGNNVLHLAGMLVAEERFGSACAHQDLICNEELWFQKVKKIVPPTLKGMKNNKGFTPKELFYMEHKESSEKAVIEVTGSANTYMIVVALIITLGITGALSIRNNQISEHTHFLPYMIWFKLFLLSIGCGVSLCAMSLLFLSSILIPSTWTNKRGYVSTRLLRVELGYLSLYSSFLVVVILSIFSGLNLVYSFFPIWVFYFINVITVFTCALYTTIIFYPPLYGYLRKQIKTSLLPSTCSNVLYDKNGDTM